MSKNTNSLYQDWLSRCLSIDRPKLYRRLRELKMPAHSIDALDTRLAHAITSSQARYAERLNARPQIRYAEDLPVNARRAEIAQAIATHQVVIVCGETGSGKTTQLPKICLELGRGVAGLIGHTQPRRIAARATAARIAQELKSELGAAVGYKIRFTDKLSSDSYIKLMTDGILLAETQNDAYLNAYDTIIIDEAHERSLNIDFLLGYLKQLLPKRPDLKIIVTSATLDAQRFAHHFARENQNVPVIEVSGRLYPIEICYRPIDDEAKVANNSAQKPSGKSREDLYAAIADTVTEAHNLGSGDTLVFLPGEREIREAAEALCKTSHLMHKNGMEIMPLFARQSAQEQARIWSPSNGRRVVLTTNVAETSLTVPGIRYVIDSGLARINRYSYRNKVELLQIEKIAQSAAKQRAGRCGRVADGVCFRLYSEDDFNARLAHTEPEILRSSLAGVILRMKSLRLGSVEDFPFLEAPSPRMISDGYQLLQELGAVDDDKNLTALGHTLAKLPLDPKIGRMLLAARERDCLREVLVIASALSVQDPRERPADATGSADQAHAKFKGGEADMQSEFLWYVHCYRAFDEIWQHKSSSKQKAWCKQNFLSYLRMREWRDIHAQLHSLCSEHGWRENNQIANYEQIHKALLAGLLGHIGCKLEEASGPNVGAYQGARGIKFWLAGNAKKAGKWVVASELVDTTRLYARCIAKIEPEWIEEVGAHLLKTHVFDPYWSKQHGRVRAWVRGVMHGITLFARRACNYDLDLQLARELFIREALVAGEIDENSVRQMPFLHHNQKLMAEIERLEHKSRRPDVLVDEALIEAFYDEHIPAEVSDLRSFEAWRKQVELNQPRLLFLEREQLMRHEAAGITTDAFPAYMLVHGQRLKLSYNHAPNAVDDGVTLTVPLALLNQISAARCEWLVPGMLEEKVHLLCKTVPQKIRHRLQPIMDYVRSFIEQAADHDQPLLFTLQKHIETTVSLKLPVESLKAENLPTHCFMNFRVLDEHGRMLGQSRSLAELRARYREQVRALFDDASLKSAMLAAGISTANAEKRANDVEVPVSKSNSPISNAASAENIQNANDLSANYSELTTWSFGRLPELLEIKVAGRDVIGFPALVDMNTHVDLRPFDTEEEAALTHRQGLIRLFALNLKEQVKAIEKGLPGMRELALQAVTFTSEAELKAQILYASLDRACLQLPLPNDEPSFIERCNAARQRMTLIAQEIVRLASNILTEYSSSQKKLASIKAHTAAYEDMAQQLQQLMPKNFIAVQPYERLQHFARYLKGIQIRIDKLRTNPSRDVTLMNELSPLLRNYEREYVQQARAGIRDSKLEEFRWLLEELRVSLFAQELKTPMPVSVKRLQKIWQGHG